MMFPNKWRHDLGSQLPGSRRSVACKGNNRDWLPGVIWYKGLFNFGIAYWLPSGRLLLFHRWNSASIGISCCLCLSFSIRQRQHKNRWMRFLIDWKKELAYKLTPQSEGAIFDIFVVVGERLRKIVPFYE